MTWPHQQVRTSAEPAGNSNCEKHVRFGSVEVRHVEVGTDMLATPVRKGGGASEETPVRRVGEPSGETPVRREAPRGKPARLSIEDEMMIAGVGDEDLIGLGEYVENESVCPLSVPERRRKNMLHPFTITVDSGAAENVLPVDMFPEIELEPSKGSLAGQFWVSAKGERIYNLGQKLVEFETDEGHKWKVMWQVAQVTKPLLSANRITDQDNEVVLKKAGACIVNPKGRKTALKKQGKVFTLCAWSKSLVFTRQGP
jgi:hypothetical protein